MKETSWFYIEPYVHISAKRKSALLYNTLDGRSLSIESNEKVLDLICRIDHLENLRVVEISEEVLSDPEVSRFIDSARKAFMGDLIRRDLSIIKPVVIPPVVRVEKDLVENEVLGEDSWKHDDPLNYLLEVSFYLSGARHPETKILTNAYKQFLVCREANETSCELRMEKINLFLRGLELKRVNVLGGNIFNYSEYDSFVEYLSTLRCRTTLFAVYSDFLGKESKLEALRNSAVTVEVAVPPPISRARLTKTVAVLKDLKIGARFVFIVADDNDVRQSEKSQQDVIPFSAVLRPYFNGTNLPFFRKRVYMTKRDILSSRISMRDIHQRAKLDPGSFGRLIVLENGAVYSNVNCEALGIIGETPSREIVSKQMHHSSNWFRTRLRIKPCDQCVLQLLCPPPSGYEDVIGSQALCNVRLHGKET